jgi:DUF1680 family protein
VETPAPAEFTVYVRIPGWLQSPASISVNGKSMSVPAERGTFAAVRRVWRNNDTLQVNLPFSFRIEALDEQHPNTAALMRGPLMLVALNPPSAQTSVTADSLQSLKAVPSRTQTFQFGGGAETFLFAPFYTVGNEKYTTYLETA